MEPGTLHRHLDIENGLGICGDDAEALILQFARVFQVDVSHFELDQYFSPEPNWWKSNDSASPRQLTIGDLEKAIHQKTLI